MKKNSLLKMRRLLICAFVGIFVLVGALILTLKPNAKVVSADTTYLDTTVTAFGDPDTGAANDAGSQSRLWFTLSANDYSAANQSVDPTQMSDLNLKNKVKLTLQDGTQKYLSEYVFSSTILYLWGRAGSPIAIEIPSFNYRTLQSVTIESGCEFPSNLTKGFTDVTEATVYRTTAEVTFINNGDGTFAKKVDTSVTAFGDPSSDRQVGWLWLTLSANDYSAASQQVNATQVSSLNLKDKIKMTLSDGTQKYLSEYAIASTWLHLWGRANTVAIEISGFDYTTLTSVTVEAGCNFPSFATFSATSLAGSTVYGTSADVTFTNIGDGVFVKKVETSVTAFGDPDIERQVGWLWLTLSANDYSTASQQVNATQVSSLNLKDKIKMTLSNGTQKYLSEYTIGSTYLYLWGRANTVAIEISGFDYTTLTSVTIESGCDFPSYASYNAASLTGGTVYSTSADVTFTNVGGGMFATAVNKNEGSITGVQLRGADTDSRRQYFVIRADAFNDSVANADDVKYGTACTTFDKIKVYTSATDEGTTLADLNVLHHCVGRMNYDQKFAREETLIFFIRNVATPNIPFVTVEYSLEKHKILQCYGYHDTKPDTEVLNYVNKIWLPYANRKVRKIQKAA